jgi:hypothetical protein
VAKSANNCETIQQTLHGGQKRQQLSDPAVSLSGGQNHQQRMPNFLAAWTANNFVGWMHFLAAKAASNSMVFLKKLFKN